MYQGPAQAQELKACQQHLCKNNIHSKRDFNFAAVALKKKLREEGIVHFEQDARYIELLRCKQEIDDYPDEAICKNLLNPVQDIPPSQYAPQPQPQSQEMPAPGPGRQRAKPRYDGDEDDWDYFDNWHEYYKEEKNRKNAPKPCLPGQERNPITKRCRKIGNKAPPKPKPKQTKKASPAPKKASPKNASPKRAKTQKVKPCKSDEEVNPDNGKCRKRCLPGTVRYALTGRCRKA